MIKKTIKYTDFNDVEREEDFFFHLNKAELIQLEMSEDGGLSERIKALIAADDGNEIMRHFREIILLAVGQRSKDGSKFTKSEEFKNEFATSDAFGELLFELATDADKAAQFTNGIVPSGMAEQVAKVAKKK